MTTMSAASSASATTTTSASASAAITAAVDSAAALAASSSAAVDSVEPRHLKCLLLGDDGIGKTSFVMTARSGSFPREYIATEYDTIVPLPQDFVASSDSDPPIVLHLWDTPGPAAGESHHHHHHHHRLWSEMLPHVDCFLLCFSLADADANADADADGDGPWGTLANVRTRWSKLIETQRQQAAGGVPIILLGLKADARHVNDVGGDKERDGPMPASHQSVTTETGQAIAKEIGAEAYLECSTMEQPQESVKAVLHQVLRSALHSKRQEQQQSGTLDLTCVIIGPPNVGKTRLCTTAASGHYPTEHLPMVPDEPLPYHAVTDTGAPVTLHLWDTLGSRDARLLRKLTYRDTHVFLICFALDDPDSLLVARTEFLLEHTENCPDVPYFLVGLKSDLRDDEPRGTHLSSIGREMVTREEAEDQAYNIGALAYIECAARTRQGLTSLFDQAVRAALNYSRLLLDPPKPRPKRNGAWAGVPSSRCTII